MRKLSQILFSCFLLSLSLHSNAQVTIGTVDDGFYTPGSTIAATFTLGNTPCLQIGNTFELYLSDANGVFSSTVPIGTFSGFYSTFVNGIIPAGTPAGSGYRLRIKTTSPASFSAPSSAFEIRVGPPVEAKISSFPVLAPEVFGNCIGKDNTEFDFNNESTPLSLVSGTIFNELNKTLAANLLFLLPFQSFNANLAHYTVFIKAKTLDGRTGTKAYMIVNNNAFTSFSTPGNNIVCLPGGFLQYGVDLGTATGMQNNYPGNTYKIIWGDNTQNVYTLCDLASTPIRHSYLTSSCGNPPYSTGGVTQYNVFGITISVESPYCGSIGTPISTSAKVVTKPKNDFTYPTAACTNAPVSFINTSTPGQDPTANTVECSDNNIRYNWFVNNVKIAANVPVTTNFVYTFPAHGVYTIRLESVGSSVCPGDPMSHNICIQDPPKPDFDFNGAATTGCAPFTIKARDKSIIDNSCNNSNVYNWIVSPSTGVSFVNGIAEPTFSFSNPGIYTIVLEINTASCGAIRTLTKTIVIVDSAPTATLSPSITLCTLGSYNFDSAPGPTNTQFTGTQVDLPDTYTWLVTESDGSPLAAGDFSFDKGTGTNTKYPSILFNKNKTYKITVIHKNSCKSVSSSQLITFSPSPVSKITAIPNPICYQASVNLQGAITSGSSSTFQWSSTGGGVFTSPNSLTTTYTPSIAERNLGTAQIKLLVNTGLTGACAFVEDNITVTILPNNTGTATAQNICSGTALNYTPSSIVTGSTFTWTSANADGNATGFTPSGTGNITDVITNTNATANAVVVYTITPLSNGCAGVPFTFTVTVTPRPVITAAPAKPAICSNQSSAITLTSNLPVNYTWTSTATAGITGNSNQTNPISTTSINDILLNTGTAQGTVVYTVTPISSSGCTGTPLTVTIAVDPSITIANAGQDESICDITSHVLNGNAPLVGTGTWSLTSTQTGVVFGNINDPKTTVTGLTAGQTYTFRWTISASGACTSSSSDVNIIVNTPTLAGTITGDATVCAANNSGSIKLSGNVGTIVRWESSTDNGVNWQPIANTTDILTYSNISVLTQYRVVVKNGGCDSKFSNVATITVTRATSIAQAGTDQNLCNETSVTLNGNNPQAGDMGLWSMISGNPNAKITDPSNPKTTVTALVAGQIYVFRWTITGAAPCGPTSSDVSINNLPALSNSISSTSSEVCYGQTINITGSLPTGGNGTYTYIWESSADDGVTWSTITGETNKDLNFKLLATLKFRRTVTSNTCTLLSNILKIIAQPPIDNNKIAADQVICSGLAPAPLTGSLPTGADGNYNYQWQTSLDNGNTWTNINAAVFQNYTPPALTTTTWYRRTVSTITCNGALQNLSAPVKITVNPNAKAEYTFTTDNACTPFVIDAQNIKTVVYPDRNASYTWYADNVQIGTGSTFPGYTITANNTSVVIKLVASSSLSCTPDEFSHTFGTSQSIIASFTQSATQGCGPLLVNFVNTSTSLTNASFKWDFGNGTTSSQTMPSAVTFLPDPRGKDTTYTVTLTAITGCGNNSFTSTVFVKAKALAVFSPRKTVGCSPMKVTFSNTSPGGTNTYYYDFGDGTLLTKTDKSTVEHTYTTGAVKDFVVTMVAENECGRDQSSYTIRVSPNTILPELVVNANEKEGCAPLKVNFYNNSKGGSSFTYDFGDGSTQVTRTAPEVVTHTFTTSGIFKVTLTASNGCSDTTTTESIKVLPQPLASFNAALTLGCPGLAVQFKNTTTGGIAYLWDFGDGNTSTEFEPTHIFNGSQEYYTITLTATNTLGCTYTTVKNQYIHIVQPPLAKFNVVPSTLINIPNYTFSFQDESTNGPITWLWDFGDHQTSTLQNPIHTYADTGSYVVTLRVTNQQSCFTSTFKKVSIVGVPGYLFVPNSFMPGSETPELRQFKAKGSGIKTWKMSIFNKWGQQLWETTKLDDGRPLEGWDGVFNSTPAPQDVYFWKIDVEFINGTAWKGMTYGSSAPKKTGVIHLIR